MRAELESKMLVQWTTKVDALMLYMAQLEDRIKIEQEARQKLAEAYDASLTNGFSRLTLETQMLQVNPLIGEVVILDPVRDMKRSGDAEAISSPSMER